jgi:hypothetical protein
MPFYPETTNQILQGQISRHGGDDCLSLIQRLKASGHDVSQVGSSVQDIKLMARGFTSVSFCHVNRSLNEAAYLLARACDVSSLCFFSISALELIQKTLCNDVK